MKTARNKSGKSQSVPRGLLIGELMGLIITLTGSGLIAKLIHSEKISWDTAGYCIMVMLLSASFLSASVSYRLVNRQPLVITGMSGILYFAVLMCMTGLFFGGKFSSLFETALLILAGSGTAGLICASPRRRGKGKKGIRYC